MDANRTISRLTAVALAAVACIAFVGSAGPFTVAAPGTVVVRGADDLQDRAVTWAVRRFRSAGLADFPAIEITFHADRADCDRKMGLYLAGRIDLCTRGASEPYARKFILHEIAHAWVQAHVETTVRDRFMRLRGVRAWNLASDEWKSRGVEQSAEILAWGLGEGEIAPLVTGATNPASLRAAFTLLTDLEPITPAAV